MLQFRCEAFYRQKEFNTILANKETCLKWEDYKSIETLGIQAENINAVLEEVFTELQNEPDKYLGIRSMSVGDLVVINPIINGMPIESQKVFRCQMSGWSELY